MVSRQQKRQVFSALVTIVHSESQDLADADIIINHFKNWINNVQSWLQIMEKLTN
jgi:hypothetical protein